ncbi:MAG: tRNA (cytidine(56)-2'-O)-methyltransferase [Nitrososphaeraceae archaeon]
MIVAILRLGHRLVRDDRTTTHVALVARAFGCQKLYMTGVDDSIKLTIDDVNDRWGYSNFEIEIVKNWKNVLKKWKENGGFVIHITMYGINVDDFFRKATKSKEKILLIVGAEKVPSEVYKLSDYNISVSNQPHSEIAALAIVLDRIFNGQQLKLDFKSAKLRIIPSATGKLVEKEKIRGKNDIL